MRVIAGTLGGRRLEAPRGRATRPTSDRVREALFSALGDLTGLSVLDLYAGSGALAIEALSRGAAHAVLVERAGPALRCLRGNLHALGLEARGRVLALDVARAAKPLAPLGPFQLVLADPPWPDVAAGRVVAALGPLFASPSIIELGSRVVVEHAARDQPPTLEGLAQGWTRRYGDTALTLFVVETNPCAPPGPK